MILYILRGAFILLATAVTVLYVLPFQKNQQVTNLGLVAAMVVGTIAVAAAIVGIDIATRRKRLSAVAGIFLGLIAGLLAAYALSFMIDLVGVLFAPENTQDAANFINLLVGVKVVIGLITCYLGISLVIQTKDDFRFVIPYVEFAKEVRGNRPTLLDTSVIIDGRVLDVIQTRVMQGSLVIPKFVLDELQTVADSADKIKRSRGRRGLDILQKLEEAKGADVRIDSSEAEGVGVDQKLVSLALQQQARIMTNDFNLNKVAMLRGVEVINMNDLAKAMRPVVMPGERMTVKMVKPGEGPAQGVGYLEDGTMVVVEGGRKHMDQLIDLSVTSTLQTSAGRMIFGKYEGPAAEATPPAGSKDSSEPAPPSEASGAPPQPRPRRPGSGRNPRRG